MSIRLAIYARVSTTNHGQDAGLQTRELRQFGEARGWVKYLREQLRAGSENQHESCRYHPGREASPSCCKFRCKVNCETSPNNTELKGNSLTV